MRRKTPRRKLSGKYAPKVIRWTIEGFSREMDLHSSTLSKRIKSSGIIPGPDGMFSTRDMVAACLGDLNAERIKKLRVERELLEVELAEAQGLLVRIDQLQLIMSDICVALRQVVRGSKLSQSEQAAMMRELREVKPHELVGK